MDIIGWLRTWFSHPLKGGPGWVFCLLLCLPMTSCEFFELDEVGAETATKMSLEQDTLFVMVGDTFSLNPVFTPDTVNITDLFFMPEDSDVVAIRGVDKLEAVSEGGTKLYVTSVSARLLDSCMVYVFPRWETTKRIWPYETVFYARVTFDGKSLPEGMLVAAFVGNECRAFGQQREAHGVPYTVFRVGSDLLYDDSSGPIDIDPSWEGEDDEEDEDEEDEEYDDPNWDENYDAPFHRVEEDEEETSNLPVITFRCYDQRRHRFYKAPVRTPFDGEAHGSISELFEINF